MDAKSAVDPDRTLPIGAYLAQVRAPDRGAEWIAAGQRERVRRGAFPATHRARQNRTAHREALRAST